MPVMVAAGVEARARLSRGITSDPTDGVLRDGATTDLRSMPGRCPYDFPKHAEFCRFDLGGRIPLPDHSGDIVTAIEVIELWRIGVNSW